MATREDIPFTIEQVAEVMNIKIKRVAHNQLICICPFCSDRSGHMNINRAKQTFRCPRCGTGGGILDLYAKYHQIARGTAYRELLDLIVGQSGVQRPKHPRKDIEVVDEEVPIAPVSVRNDTYTALMDQLQLTAMHRESLLGRGLNSDQIVNAGYRTTPAVRAQKIATTLANYGCQLEGVPGFYINKETGQWELDIRGSGIMLPDRNIHGEIEAIQIRLDKSFRSKFNNLTSTGQYFGATAACCPHFVGFVPGMDTVYVTEGIMKSDIAYYLSKDFGKDRAFIGITGVANTNQVKRALKELSEVGVNRIVLAFDSDYEFNPNVARALMNTETMATEAGFDVVPLCWDPHYKGIDDLLLSFKEC